MAYNYVVLRYSGLNVRVYYIDKNDEKISFYTVDTFAREESKLNRITYLTRDCNQTVYIDDPTKLVAELINVNYNSFLVFDDCTWQRQFSGYSKIEFHHHSEFNVLYHADNFNRNGVLEVLKNHGFLEKIDHRQISTVKKWLLRKCEHIFKYT